MSYEPTTGLLSILKKPLNARKAPWQLSDLKSNEEDELKYKVWRNLKKEGYKVISEPKPKHVEFSEPLQEENTSIPILEGPQRLSAST